MSLAGISAEVRLFVLIVTVLGFALACGALLSAHLNAVSVQRNGVGRDLARARRASEAWSLVGQTVFLVVGVSFIVFPPGLPATLSQIPAFVDGLLRMAGFGVGALALAIKSVIALVTETRILRSL